MFRRGKGQEPLELDTPVAIGGWQDIRIGDFVRDRISGLTGTVIERIIFLYGCDHIVIEGEAKDGKLGDRTKIPVERFELLRSQPEFHRDEDYSKLHVKLGDRAKDAVSGMEGTVTMIHILMFGLLQVCIDPDYNAKDKKMPEAYFVDSDRIIRVKEQEPPRAPEPVPPPKPAAEKPKRTRGGPNERVTRAAADRSRS